MQSTTEMNIRSGFGAVLVLLLLAGGVVYWMALIPSLLEQTRAAATPGSSHAIDLDALQSGGATFYFSLAKKQDDSHDHEHPETNPPG